MPETTTAPRVSDPRQRSLRHPRRTERRAQKPVLRPRVAWTFLAVGAVVLAGYVRYVNDTTGTTLMIAAATAGIAAMIYGIRRNRPTARAPWVLMTIGCVLFLVGLYTRTKFGFPLASPPVSSIPDVASVAGYGFFTFGLFRMLRIRANGKHIGALSDGLVVAAAAVLFSWMFLITPVLGAPGIPLPVVLANAVYPVLDVIVVYIVLRMAFTNSLRTTSFWLLLGTLTSILVGDTIWSSWMAGIFTATQHMGNTPFIVSYFALGAAALHPSMRALAEPQRASHKPMGPARVGAIALALAAPVLVAIIQAPWSTSQRWVMASTTAVIIGAVLVRAVSAVNQHAKSEAKMTYQANHDALTSLPNRYKLLEHLSDALTHASVANETVSVLFIDMDRFKFVNDTWGHATGDELLKEVGARLKRAVRADDLVARVGGDEFLIVATAPVNAPVYNALGERIIEMFSEPISLTDVGEVFLTPSIGVATADARNADKSGEDLIRDADTAMYRAKDSGRNRMVEFDANMRANTEHRFAVETDLRRALERGELEMHYQPVVDIASGRWKGFEALMRWNHPENGMVSPGDFIPVAEETGLIVPLGQFAMQESTKQLAAWRAQYNIPDLSMAVNLSPRQMTDPGVVDMVANAVRDSQLPPGRLWVEITESLMIDNSEGARQTLEALRDVGVHLSMDDFGTGYSSLSYLKDFPIDRAKIDRSFVSGLSDELEDSGIVKAVIEMAKARGLSVIAEGVETEQQAQALEDLECTLAQGYLYSRPLAAHAIEALLAEGSVLTTGSGRQVSETTAS